MAYSKPTPNPPPPPSTSSPTVSLLLDTTSSGSLSTRRLDLSSLGPDIVAAVGHIVDVVALLELLVESLILATANATWTSLNADEVNLAVIGRWMESIVLLLLAKQLRLEYWCGATEAQEGLSVAVLHLVGPVALVGGRIPGQTHGAVKHEATSRSAVHELAAVARVAHAIIAKLMWTIVAGLCRLQTCLWLAALHIDGIAAGIASRLLVVQQSIGAELLLGHAVLALDVCVTGARDGRRSVGLAATAGCGMSCKRHKAQERLGLIGSGLGGDRAYL